jgi:ankyrin repeat protein
VGLRLENGAEVNARTIRGRTALIQASQGCYLQIAQALIEKGADVNAREEQHDTTALQFLRDAAPDQQNCGALAELLRQHGGHE